MMLDARVVPLLLVTVCGASEALDHSTLVPFGTVSVAGANPYLSFVSEIFTCATLELDDVVPAGAAVAVGAAVFAPPFAPPLVLVPHPARSRIPASRIPDHHGMPRAFVRARLFIGFLLSLNESFNCPHSRA